MSAGSGSFLLGSYILYGQDLCDEVRLHAPYPYAHVWDYKIVPYCLDSQGLVINLPLPALHLGGQVPVLS